MKKITIIIGVFLLSSMFIAAQSFEDVDYIGNNEVISNPERGFYHQVDKFTNENLRDYKQNGIRIILKNYDIGEFKSKPLSADFLRSFGNDLNIVRQEGFKIILRFAYTFHVTTPYGDAPPDIVLTHINQLKYLLRKNSDIILTFQAGFIGTWGEWYYTDYFSQSPGVISEKNWEDRRAVVNKLLDVLPQDRMIQLRTPTFIRQILQEDEFVAITKQKAYDLSAKARLGLHNDCFVANYSDYGTYQNVMEEKAFLEDNSKYTIVGGETCNKNSLSNCENSLKELKRFHWSFLNIDYHQGVLSQWRQEGCFEDIQRNLGYRYQLTNAILQNEAKPNGKINFEINIINSGYANPTNEYTIEFVLQNIDNGDIYTAILNDDLRKWDLNADHKIDFLAGIPGNIAQGKYKTYVRIKDKRPTLSYNPEYSIAFANDSIFDKNTGFNDLNHIVVIKNEDTFDDYTGTNYFVKQGRIDTSIEPVEAVKIVQYNDDVLLYWANNSNGQNKAIKIQRLSDGDFKTISIQDTEEKYYIDKNLEPGKRYNYKIQNIDGSYSSLAKEVFVNKTSPDRKQFLEVYIDGQIEDWDIVPPVMTGYLNGLSSLKFSNTESMLNFAIESPIINSFKLYFTIDTLDYKISGDSLFTFINGDYKYKTGIELMSNDTFVEGSIDLDEINFEDLSQMEGQIFINDTLLKDSDNRFDFLKFKTLNTPERFKVKPSVVTPFSKVKINWKIDSNFDGYIIEKSVGDEQHFEFLKQLKYNDSYYLDGGLDSSKVYYYRMFAYSGIIRSAYTKTIKIKLGNPNSILGNIEKTRVLASIYPNPMNDCSILKIKSKDNLSYTIELYNEEMKLLKKIFKGQLSIEKKIPVKRGDLKQGTYFIVARSVNNRILLKLIIL